MKTLRLTLFHGVWWPGHVLKCYSDDAETEPSDLAEWGWVPQHLKASRKPGGEAAFTVPVQAGPGDHEVTLLPIEGAAIAAMPEGDFTADLVFVNADGKTVGPFARIVFTVEAIYHS